MKSAVGRMQRVPNPGRHGADTGSGGAGRRVDCHVHIIDPARFRYEDGAGYRPKPHETGTRESLRAVLDGHDVGYALLVQPSCYGCVNAALLDAMAAAAGRWKGIAVVDPETPERELAALRDAGVVGVRFNLVAYDPDALRRPGGGRFLARLKALGWYVQVYADDAQWPEAAAVLLRSGVKVLVDHFGVRNIADGVAQSGFQAVLDLGRRGGAAVKLSAPFRLSRQPGRYADVAPFAQAVIAAFGVERCIWGSDWPFINLPAGVEYADTLAALARWIPDPADRDQVLWHNPVRLFGFGE